MSNLPVNWASCCLGDLVESISNGMPGTQNKEGVGIPVSRIETIANQQIDFSRIGYISQYDENKLEKFKLTAGDILFSHINSPIHIGKTAIFDDGKLLYHGINLLRIKVNNHFCDYRYFNYACRLLRANGQFSLNAQHAVNQSSLNQTKISGFEIQLAPLKEQRRIADKLDTTLARVDALNDRLARIPPLLKRFRQSVLAAATSGRLTEDWRSQNDIGSEWLNEPAKVLSNLVELDMGFAFKSAEFVDNDGIRLLRGDNIEPGNLRWTDAKKYPEDKFEEKRHILLSCNDIVLAMDRPIISTGLKIAKVKNEDLPCLLVQRVCRVKCGEHLQNDYAYLLLNSQNFIDHLLSVQNGSSVPHISGKQIISYKVKIPSLKEQTEIVRRVASLFAFADRLEARLQSAQTAAERLTPALLAKAFRGELVPQDPNDEPAAELLRRLREAHAAQAPAKPRRKKQ